MAKTRSQQQGPVLSQRDRKKAAAQSRAEAEAAQKDKQRIDEEEAKKEDLIQRTPIPQEQFLNWLAWFCKTHFTTSRFVQLSALLFVVQQAYLAFEEEYQSEKDINLLISTVCALVALLAGIAITIRVKFQIRKQKGETGPVPLPPWNAVYLVFLAVMLPFVYKRDLLLYNAALTSSVLDLPWFAKIAIQVSLVSSNTSHNDTLFNLKVIGLNTIVQYFLTQITELKSLDEVEVSLFSILLTDVYIIDSQELYFVVLQKLLVSFGVGASVLYAITRVWTSNTTARSCVLLASWGAAFVGTTLHQLDPILGKNSLVWLYEYITATSTRISIIALWLISLVLLIPTIFSYKVQFSPNFRRKIWHFLVLGLVSLPLHLDPEFVKLSLSGCLVLFLIVEQTRYLKLHPFGEFLDQHLRTFADFRDERGPIIFSYIYLIIGITLPILFNNSVAGLVVLGVGDSLASIIGSNWGEIKWSRSNKTVEGTMGFIVASFLVSALFKLLGWFFEDSSYNALLLACTVSGILEGNSDMNDNIMIPGFMCVLLEATN
ncbi:CYFA0S14e00870g1_1 [Cyberlindnera fabianii]|uniref:dolichol kinase n=1 Tax=Cyberlindnera fabianii TaxID=36022 RepID=A0A061B8J6_CYBFA|nr:Dolichol kinase [Cyberlindnera fabianii]CDR44210.1 CYFA0S14e00870g1_1 [Cyberlindnera fabianii]